MTEKLAYSFHPITLEFTGVTQADECQLEPGRFYFPAHSTDIQPPEPRSGFTRHFKDGEWALWPIVTGEDVPPGQEPTLDDVKRDQIKTIDTDRDYAIASGFEHDGSVFDSYPDALANIAGSFSMALDDAEFTTGFITMDDNIIEMTNEQVRALGRTAYNHKRERMLRARALKDQVLAADTVDGVRAITW